MIAKSPDLANAERWFERMREADVRPNDITFNTMIAKSPDLANAERIKKIAAESGF